MNVETKGYDPVVEAQERIEVLENRRGALMAVVGYCEGREA